MESAFAALSTATTTAAARTGGPSLPLLTISKALNNHLSGVRRLHPLLLTRTSLRRELVTRRLRCFYASRLSTSNFSCCRTSSAAHHSVLRSFCAVVAPEIRRRLQCFSSSAAPFGSVSGGGGLGGGDGRDGGRGGGGSDGGDSKSKLGAGAGDGVSAPSSDVIILDVGGMTCGGCAASVKKILESQPQVSSASVNLTTETAIVWPVLEARSVPNWQKELGELLAKHLSNCGFQSTPREDNSEAIQGDISP